MKIPRTVNFPGLVLELGGNKTTALELLREALSNAKDHKASRLFVRIRRDAQGRVSIMLVDDGEGLNEERWRAFWGAAWSAKTSSSVGYKGFGTKLFFRCGRLSVASRTAPSEPWLVVTADRPYENDETVDAVDLTSGHPLHAVISEVGLLGEKGTAIAIDDLQFSDKDQLLARERIESYCDWFSVIGDIRAGLFETRLAFHRAIAKGGAAVDGLRVTEVELRPIEVQLQINGERQFTPLGIRRPTSDKGFYAVWTDDLKEFGTKPSILMFGHRFADQHTAGVGRGGQAKDDRTALRLTDPSDWVDEHGIAVVARVEGHRRQRETYLEARWQNKKGAYSFDERFGLWLCRDYVPVVQRNDLLRKAIEEAEPRRAMERDFRSLRNWKVFVNDQGCLPIANRGDISNFAEREGRIYDAVVAVLRRAFQQSDFAEWVEKLRTARRERERDAERAQMERRRQEVVAWVNKKSPGSLDASEARLAPLDLEESLRLREPRNEQELFYLYAQLTARFEVPAFILEYNTREGVDAIGRVSAAKLLPAGSGYARIEFKYEVESGYPIGHYFDAIDLIICWSVGKPGPIDEEAAAGLGRLRRRPNPVLTPPFDTHEIAYDSSTGERVIPVLQIREIFTPSKTTSKKGAKG